MKIFFRHLRHLPPGSVHPVQGSVEQWNSFLDLEHKRLRWKRRTPHFDPLCALSSNWRGLNKLTKQWRLLCSQTLCPSAKKTQWATSSLEAFQSHFCATICQAAWLTEQEEQERIFGAGERNSSERVEQDQKAAKKRDTARGDGFVYSEFERAGKRISFHFVL